MGSKEQQYIDRFLEQIALRGKIESAIADLKSVCEATGNWRKVADDLSSIPMTLPGSPWSDDRLRNLMSLKSLLVQYGSHKSTLLEAWVSLSETERVGLATPDTLDH